jgi:hypothetical protein
MFFLALSSVGVGGLARSMGDKRSVSWKMSKKEVSCDEKMPFCFIGKATYLYHKPEGAILGHTSDKVISSDGGWGAGLSLGLGFDLRMLDWHIDLLWSYSAATPCQHVSQLGLASIIDGSTYSGVEQWLDLKVNRGLLLWSCALEPFKRCIASPVIGTEALWLHQKRTLRYYNESGDMSSEGKNNFAGLGTTAGLGLDYALGLGWNWKGSGLFSLIWGKFHTKGTQTYDDTAVRPVIHLSTGLAWSRTCPSGSIEIGALYEVHHYFSQNQMRYQMPPYQPVDTDFSQSGPSLYARVCF